MAVVEAGTQRALAVVGEPVPRVDAPAKVTGAARYVDDLPAPNAHFGRTVRSPVAHGVLRAIRLDPTFDWRGVTVVTAADIPGRNCILLNTDDEPALVAIGDRVRYVAQGVALVAASSPETAADAAAHVILDIDPLPPVLTVEESLRGDVEVHPGGNVLHEVKIERGDVDAAFAAADVVVEGTYRTGPAEHVYLEPQGMLAWWDGGVLHVTGSLQCPYFIHRALAAMFDLDTGAIDVTQATTGGGFGGKEEFPSTLAAHAALLARCAGRPVKMIYERGEDIASTTKRHPSKIRHRLAATHDGRLVAADVDVVLDAGAFVTLSPVVVLRSVLHVTGPYRIPHVRIHGRAVATNHAAERRVPRVRRTAGDLRRRAAGGETLPRTRGRPHRPSEGERFSRRGHHDDRGHARRQRRRPARSARRAREAVGDAARAPAPARRRTRAPGPRHRGRLPRRRLYRER